MKYTLTILFACVLVGAKAQKPTEQTEPDKFQKPAERLVGHDMTKPTIIVVSETKRNICIDCDNRRGFIKKEPAPPVDKMVRHYFAMSYWD